MNIDKAPSPFADAPESETDLRSQIERYVSGEIEEIEITNMRQIENVMHQFKELLLESRSQENVATSGQPDAAMPIQPEPTAVESAVVNQPPAELTASTNSKPAFDDKKIEIGDNIDDSAQPAADKPEAPNSETIPPLVVESGSALKNDDEAFNEWTGKDGAALNNEYHQLMNRSRELRTQFRAGSAKVNATKRKIDELSSKLNVTRSKTKPINHESSDAKIIIDEDEFAVICELKQRKAEYMVAFKEWERIKIETTEAKERIQKMKTQMVHGFLQWCDRKRAAENVDILDDGEQFDKLETERILSTDPESLPYYNARKALLRNANKKRTIRRMVASR